MAGQERTYLLGGETRRRTMFDVTARQMLIGGVYLCVWMFLLLATYSIVVLVVGTIGALIGMWLKRRRTALGESWAAKAGASAAFKLAHRKGGPDFVPGQALPPEVGGVKMYTYKTEQMPAALAILHHKDARRDSWVSGHFTVTLEIRGGGDGIQPVRAVNTAGLRFERLLGGLASAEIPVDQVDITTRILPVAPDAYREHMQALIAPGTPAKLRRSMRQLSNAAAHNTEEYRSFCTIRMPVEQLAAGVSGRADLDRLCEEAVTVVGEVVRRFELAGYQTRHVLGPRRLGALIRHLHDPDMGIDDLRGLRTAADGWDYLRWADPRWVKVEGVERDWYHAVAHVPRDAWPAQAVGARWMEHLVTRINPATIRTVHAQFRLVPKARARDLARIGLTYDTAASRTERKKGQVSTGETEASMSASRRTLQDLLRPVVAGVYPSVRVMISAPDDPEQLAAARRRVTSAAEDGGLTRLAWEDNKHHRALVTTMPLARGVQV